MLEDVGNDAGAVYHTTHVNLAPELEMPNEEIQRELQDLTTATHQPGKPAGW